MTDQTNSSLPSWLGEAEKNPSLPDWLKAALGDEAWLKDQQAAWEPYCTPGHFGYPVPRFLLLSEENLQQLPVLLARHCRQRAEHLQAAARDLEKIDLVAEALGRKLTSYE